LHFLYFEIYNQKKRGVDFIDTQTLSGTRRDNGDGSISVRKDGTWTARIQVGRKANGKPQIKAFYGKTEVEVKRKLRNYKKEIAVVGSLDARKHSVETYIIKWLEIYKKNSISENGYDALESAVKNQVIPYLGYIQLINLTTENIQGMINGMLQKGYVVAGKEKSYSLSTIKKAYNAINACLKQAVLLGDLYKNPAMGVNLPSVKKNEQLELKEIVSFTDEEILKYIAEATRLYKTGRPVYRLGYALVIMLFTGIRQGEALDFDLADAIANKDVAHLHIAPPETTDWERVIGFCFSGIGKKTNERESYDLNIVLQTYMDKLRPDTNIYQKIRRDKLLAMSVDESVFSISSIYAALIYQTTYEGETYILCDGTWYEIN
jgi:integrase